MRIPASILCLILLAGCAGTEVPVPDDTPRLSRAEFSALPGWDKDEVGRALSPLARSCTAAMKKADDAPFGKGGFSGAVADWRPLCESLPDKENARAWFEDNFTPYAVHGSDGAEGLFTGYYQPMLRGSYHRRKPYLVPLYARPRNMITADLGDFHPDLEGKSVTGRVTHAKNGDAKLVPYFTRAEIEQGAIADQPKVVFVDSLVDAFFLHIQGSGLVTMEEGGTVQVGYAAQNGRPYTAIGRELIKRGELKKEEVSMQSIRAWLETHPYEAPALMDMNESYVFFSPRKGAGPLGAQGVALTPGRSLAVDSKLMPYGAPVFLDVEEPDGGRLQKLVIAQDTGGAIKGAVRGDYFWGHGQKAADKAGRMKSKGRYYILLPKTLTVPRERMTGASNAPGWKQILKRTFHGS